MQGRIIKGIGSYYSVYTAGEVYICRARGRFREDGVSPQVGDEVLFHSSSPQDGYIDELLPRRNLIRRPMVANIDRLVWVLSAGTPAPDLLLLDKMLIYCRRNHIHAVIVLNKCDVAEGDILQEIQRQYASSGASVLLTSAVTGSGLDALEALLKIGTSCFAGQSGAGKSSLLNALLPTYRSATGELARTGRGRHTTRHAELLPFGDGFVADTPGFSFLDLETAAPETLKDHYEEFQPYEGQCRFNGCLHYKEPDCAVREALAQGDIDPKRFERYIMLLETAKENWRKRYD